MWTINEIATNNGSDIEVLSKEMLKREIAAYISIFPMPKATEEKTAEELRDETIEEIVSTVNRQYIAAISSVQALISSGGVGPGPYLVNLSGNANPTHQPRVGWANDEICIAVYDARPSGTQVEEEKAAEEQASKVESLTSQVDSILGA